MEIFSHWFFQFLLTQFWYVCLVVCALLFLFEIVLPPLFGVQARIRENMHDFLYYQFGRSIFALVFGILIVTGYFFLDIRMGLVDITHLSLLSQVIILLFCSELCIYVAHMGAHKYRIPILSRAHAFHHTVTTDMDWTNSRKEHLFVLAFFMGVYTFFFFVVFQSSSASHVVTTTLYLVLNALSHYRVHFSWKYLDQIFLFPRDHFRHHTERSGPYGVALSLFDTIFDTRGNKIDH